MRRALMPGLFCVLAAAPGHAQNPGILHARSDLVVVDVVVTDAAQRPVHGLKASDFTLTEDKAQQQIASFEEHAPPSVPVKPAAMPVLPPGTFTNYTPAPQNGPMNILLLDALNTPVKDQQYVRKQLLVYLKHAPPGTRIAIFGLNRRLMLLQGFTSDVGVLQAAIFAKAGSQASTLLDDPSDTITDFMFSPGGTGSQDAVSGQMIATIKQFEAEQVSYELQMRQLYTLAAMNQLARYVGSIPGRKNLIWFSGSFPLNVLPDGDLADPFSVIASAQEQYRETTNLLARAQLAVYPIDARGIVRSPVHSASSPQKDYGRNPHNFARDEARFDKELFAEHDTMSQMATDTGGRAFMDTDGLTAAVAQAIDTGSNYYTFTYAPSNKSWNGHYRKIQIKLAQPRTTLAYRRGYFADDPGARSAAHKEAATAAKLDSPMSLALMRGGPMPTEILLKERVLPASTATEDAVSPGDEMNPGAGAETKGPYRRFVLDVLADPGAIDFGRAPNGDSTCAVEIVTLLYDRDGNAVERAGTTLHGDLTPEKYVATLRVGVPFHQEISVPVKGEFYLRTAVRDLSSGKVGAVEVPVAAVASLPPRPRLP